MIEYNMLTSDFEPDNSLPELGFALTGVCCENTFTNNNMVFAHNGAWATMAAESPWKGIIHSEATPIFSPNPVFSCAQQKD
ncbi:hypothetical protein G3O08_19420 [Cryomorpha ignava]|uniref:Uncharacterized protein n=1 Tax=Cryomorpha ignava TaxID=101383 RepID=A0A7K3WVU6_9FLAO|nr:hypothetical protein [Cryomorpha ignava]NEN25668.1 hypothetical protein [Cryomorpha ignava]